MPGLPRRRAPQLRALPARQSRASAASSCHSVHASETPEHLLKAEQPKLCFQCHTDQKPAFDMPFHHPVNEGAVKCSDCHDVHGTFGNNNLKSTADQNMICTKCHAETRGPFVFEHAAVKAEGCMGCHTPHGSQNARLLNMPTINTLCNQCHSPVVGRHGSRNGERIGGDGALHELPHLHSRVEHQPGVSQVAFIGAGLRCSHSAAQPGARAAGFKNFDLVDVFLSEASYEEDRLVSSALQSTALSQIDPAHRRGYWSRHSAR